VEEPAVLRDAQRIGLEERRDGARQFATRAKVPQLAVTQVVEDDGSVCTASEVVLMHMGIEMYGNRSS